MNRRNLIACVLGLGTVCAAAAQAGELIPPAGPVAPTMKALDEVEARVVVNGLPGNALATHVIAQPGSYYLTGDVVGEAGKDGIVISAEGVTLDLNGFRVVGVIGARSGIATPDGLLGFSADTRVRNGYVRGWPQRGVKLLTGTGSVESVTARDCVGDGILVFNGSVRGCTARDNGGHGIHIGYGVASDCTATGNSDHGFYLVDAGADSCHASLNTRDGFHVVEFGTITGSVSTANGENGYWLKSDGIARGCVARSNAEHGFRMVTSATAEDCAASLNFMSGFSMDEGCVARGCTSTQNTQNGFIGEPFGGGTGLPIVIDSCSATNNSMDGVVTNSGSVISRTTSSSNTGSGFRFGGGCSIAGCTAASNGLSGFQSEGGGSTVRDCAALSNTGTGYESYNSNLIDSIASQNQVGISCAGGIVRGCTAAFNTNEGISDIGGTRIEGNHVEFNGATGLLVPDFSFSLVIGNDATGNTPNITIGGANSRGSVVNHTGGGVLSSGEPRENVEH